MADLDAELLALAGDDSSGEETSQPANTAARATSPPSPAGPSTSKPNDTLTNKSNIASKGTAKMNGNVNKPKKGYKDDSEEEGEASSSPASLNSLQSAPMSESDSDVSVASPVDDDGPMFPLENKFHSQKDKEYIMSLSEVQRESILAERAQILERKLQDQHLRRLLQARGNAEKTDDKKKRKAGSADLEDGNRKSSRQKTTLGGRKVGETSDAIEAYKRQREQKGVRDEQRRREGEARKDRRIRGSIEDAFSDADAEGESDVEWDNAKPKASSPGFRGAQPADQIDYEHVRVGRDNFAKYCFYPGFDDAVKNCYVRVCIGPDKNKNNGENIYRMTQIKGFTEGKPYALEAPNGKPFITTQYALVTYGKAEKEWPFLACSNSKFTMSEFEHYKKTMAEDNLALPTKPYLISKIGDINSLINHRFTDAEIQEKLRRSGVLKTKYARLERPALIKRREEAEARGDEKAIAELDAEIAAIDGPKLAFGTSLQKAAPKPTNTGPSQQERLAALNRANRKANTHDVRKAQQAERKAEALARKAIERGEAVQNPFARVKTRAKIHYDISGNTLAPPKTTTHAIDDLFEDKSKDNSRAGTPSSVRSTTPMRSGTPNFQRSPPVVKGQLPKIGTRNMDDEIIASMDLGIDIEI